MKEETNKRYFLLLETIKSEMDRKGLKRAELARKMNIDKVQISNALNGKHVLSLFTLVELCKAVEVKASDVLSLFDM